MGYAESEYGGTISIKYNIDASLTIDFIDAEILKYFYTTLLKVAKNEEEFIPIVKRIKNHIFQRNLMYNSDLRKYILELTVNQELLYIQENMKDLDEKENSRKLVKNIGIFIRRISTQLQGFPNALNILKNYEHLIYNYDSFEDYEEKLMVYQKLVLEITKNVNSYSNI